jgi:hypothetical protein
MVGPEGTQFHFQFGTAGLPVPIRPSVLVTNVAGVPVPGVTVVFRPGGRMGPNAAHGTVTAPVAVTDTRGRATVGSWTLGSTTEQTLTAMLYAGVGPDTRLLYQQADVEFTAVARPCAAPPLSFSDDEFLDVNWTQTASGSSGSGARAFRSPSGGVNPGRAGFRTMEMSNGATFAGPTIGTPSRVVVFHARSGAVYDPARQGAIDSLAFRLHGGRISVRPGSVNPQRLPLEVRWSIALRQGGTVFGSNLGGSYTSPSTGYSGPIAWEHLTGTSGLRASDFRPDLRVGPGAPPGAQPDFSATGAPIEFGYLMTLEQIPGSMAVVAIDNWSVTLNRCALPTSP